MLEGQHPVAVVADEHLAPGAIVERLGASLAHALASPLTLIRGRADLLARSSGGADLARTARQLQEQVDGMIELLRRVQEFGQSASPTADSVELGPALAVARAMAPRAKEQGVELSVAPGIDESGRLRGGLLEAVLSGLHRYLERTGQSGALSIDRCRDQQRGVDCLRIQLALASGGELPSARRDLVDPWLQAPTANAPARLELALALGFAQRGDGWYEPSPVEDGIPSLAVFVPILV